MELFSRLKNNAEDNYDNCTNHVIDRAITNCWLHITVEKLRHKKFNVLAQVYERQSKDFYPTGTWIPKPLWGVPARHTHAQTQYIPRGFVRTGLGS